MRLKNRLFGLLGLALLCALCAVPAGCVTINLLPRMEVGSTWVSKEGKARKELYKDQQECNREVMMLRTPAFPGEMNSGIEDIRVFEGCMRSKGWVKE